jgi:predicted Zn finger-like uncharacterized protein
MSLITRCPACETLFRVVPDQLRISEGWVRCGRCDDIFDASLHLLQASPEEASSFDLHERVVTNAEAENAADAALQPIEADLDSGSLVSPDELVAEQGQELVLPDAADEAEQASPGMTPDTLAPVDELISDLPGLPDALTGVALPDPLEVEPTLPIDAAQADPDDLEPALSAEFSDVSFLRDKGNSTFWRRPLIRATLMLLSVALLLGLSGQIVFHERDRLVALESGLKPWLQTFCAALSCTLSPLRRTESIVIDSSSFAQIRGEAYRLNFTVKNTAVTALAVPAIELTLTDSRDQPVVRRVFLPGEIDVKLDALAAGSEWSASLAMAVKASSTSERVAGYRLLAFYP